MHAYSTVKRKPDEHYVLLCVQEYVGVVDYTIGFMSAYQHTFSLFKNLYVFCYLYYVNFLELIPLRNVWHAYFKHVDYLLCVSWGITSIMLLQLVVDTECYLPATTIFSSLPFRQRSLLGSWVLSAIESVAASDTESKRNQTVCEKNWENASLFRNNAISGSCVLRRGGDRQGEGRRRRKNAPIWIFIVRGQRRALHIN